VTVDTNSTAQTWEGFSGAFNERGWEYLSTLTQSDRDLALQLLFGADGCRFPIARIPIGASDYAMDRYTLDEVPSGETDYAMASFSITRDEERLIPFVKAAQAIRPDLRFWASPWTPPTWMKEGPFNTDSPFDGGSIKGDAETLGALAQYFVLFVQGYAGHGIDIEMVAPQNEPGYSGGYPTCAWAPEAYRDFVGLHLGPALENAGLESVDIMLGTFNGGTGDSDIISTVMGDAAANSYIDLLGFQWSTRNYATDAQQYGRPIWQSEHQCGNYPWVPDSFVEDVAPNDHAYAVESWGLMRDWIETGVTAYATWNMVLDIEGVSIDTTRRWPQNALLTVDTSAGTLNVTPTYYVFRHFSQFVAPGATVVATSGGDAVAFQNPSGSIVTVMYNSGGATTYVLSAGGQTLQFAMPGDGWATVMVE
jgi:glucosylceramidase